MPVEEVSVPVIKDLIEIVQTALRQPSFNRACKELITNTTKLEQIDNEIHNSITSVDIVDINSR